MSSTPSTLTRVSGASSQGSGRARGERRARSPRRQRRAEVRSAVCRATVELVGETPLKEVTVDDISRRAGVPRSTFYLHFHDKHGALEVATEEVVDKLYGEAEGWWHGDGSPRELVREALEGVIEVYQEHATVLRAAVEVSCYDAEFADFWRCLVERFVSATAAHVRREQDGGRSPQLDPDAVASSLVWMVERSCYVHLARGKWSTEGVTNSLVPVWMATLYPGEAP